MGRPIGIPSHRKGVSVESEYGKERADKITQKISNATTEQMKKSGGYWLGKKRPPISYAHKQRISESSKGRVHSEEVRKNMSLAKTGEKVFTFFRGTFKKRIRESTNYKEWRLMVFGRDAFTCQRCGKRGCYIEAHHIISFSELIKKHNIIEYNQAIKCEELWNIDNGITLCVDCHSDVDKYRNKFKKW